MMNLEEIKELVNSDWPMEPDEVRESIDWLIAEVERLSDELNAEKFRTCERCVEKTATRCAEIAYKTEAQHAAKRIHKEFSL